MSQVRGADVRVLYLRELRSALRERAIVVNSILLPIFLYPLLLWLAYTGISFVGGQTEGFSSRVMLRGLPDEHRLLRIDLERDRRIEFKTVADPWGEIRRGKLDLLVDILPPDVDGVALAGNFRVRLTADDSKDRSQNAGRRVKERIARYRERYLEGQALKLGIDARQFQQFWLEPHNVASTSQMGRFLLGLMLPLFLIIMLTVGSIHPAIDCTAGEREKSTWETLLTTGTSRTNIVLAKYLYVATLGSVAGILNLIAMLFSMRSIMAPLMGDRVEGFSFQIPLQSIPLIVLLTVLLALLVAAGMMILASFARTFKEGQSMISPLYLLIIVPMMFLQIPGLELTPVLAAIPVVNVAMVFREAIGGVYQWPLIALTVAVEAACIALALKLAVSILRYEDFMLGSYGGHFGKFLKQRLLSGKRRPAGA